jgi:hypothetical protein
VCVCVCCWVRNILFNIILLSILGAGKRRERPCLYCGVLIKTLTRHLAKVHKAEPRVQTALALPLKSRNAFFNQLKREGIKKHNLSLMSTRPSAVQCERGFRVVESQEITVCGKCSGFFSRNAFYKHKKICTNEVPLLPTSIPGAIFLAADTVDEDFRAEILSKFLRDSVGILCSSDSTLVQFGQRMFYKLRAKKDKKTEVKRSVMSDMRRIGSLFLCFKEECKKLLGAEAPANVEVKDLVCRSMFPALESAIYRCTDASDSNQMKSGLKIGLYYLLKKLAKVVKTSYLVAKPPEDAKATEVDQFLGVLALNYNFIFGDAIYNINKNREVKLRKPEELPKDSDVAKVRQYTLNRMTSLIGDEYLVWTAKEFAELRDLADCRLTLFNA